MVNEIKELFFKIAPWIILVPSYISIKNSNTLPKEFKCITLYLIVSVLTQLLSLILWTQKINNLPLLHIYTLVEFFLLLIFYYKILSAFIPKLFFYLLTILFITTASFDSLVIEGFFAFNTYTRSFEAFVFILFALIWFLKILSEENESPQINLPSLKYINAGFFIYFSGSIVLFSFSNYINQLGHALSMNIWTLHTLLLFTLYILISIGLCRIKTA